MPRERNHAIYTQFNTRLTPEVHRRLLKFVDGDPRSMREVMDEMISNYIDRAEGSSSVREAAVPSVN